MVLAPDQLLHLGPDPAGASWNHFDLGLGLSSHINYPQAQLKNSPPQGAPWWYSRTNPTSGKDVVVFSAPLGGATTSTNTQYARCELREYERDGTTKMAFDPKTGDHWIEAKYRIFGLAGLDKPEVTVCQAHDGDDDVIMVSTYQGGLRLRYNGSQVAVLDSTVADGDEFYLKIRVNNGTPSVYYSSNADVPSTTPVTTSPSSSGFFSSAASGWYFKTGSYNQTNENTDPDVDPDASILRVEIRELKHWHSVTPKGGAWPTPAAYTTTGTPTVNAGADSTFTLGGQFTRTATVTLNGATLNSQEWSILSGPTGVGTTLSSTASVSYTPTVAGIYTLGFSANTSAGTFSDNVTLTVTTVSTPVDTNTAAGRFGWGTPAAFDEFNAVGAPNSGNWSVYDGPGHADRGIRNPARISGDGSKMTITGVAGAADTGGMAHKYEQKYGKWELRARSQSGAGGGGTPVTVGVPWNTAYPNGTAYPTINGGGSATAQNLPNLANAASNSVYNYSGGTITTSVSVDFTGKSNITIRGINMAQGGKLIPKAGTNIVLEINAPYELTSGGEIVKWVGVYTRCMITNSIFGPATEPSSPTTTKNRYVQFGDSTSVGAIHGWVVRNTFRCKAGPGNPVHYVGDTANSTGGVRFNRVALNIFQKVRPFDENDHETALMGISTLQLTDGQQVIEFNRFEDCRSEPEVISMKMNNSVIRGNTYHNCVGSFCLRHGDDGAIHDNWIFGFEEETGGGSYNRTSAGPRLYGARHKIFNNTIQVNGNGGSRPSATSLFESPLTLDSGDVQPGTTSNGHANIVSVMVEKNLLVKCGNPIMVVDNYGTAPTGTVRNNWIVECANTPTDGVGTKGTSPSKAGLSISGNVVRSTVGAASLTQGSNGEYRPPTGTDIGSRVAYLTASMVGKGSTFEPWTETPPSSPTPTATAVRSIPVTPSGFLGQFNMSSSSYIMGSRFELDQTTTIDRWYFAINGEGSNLIGGRTGYGNGTGGTWYGRIVAVNQTTGLPTSTVLASETVACNTAHTRAQSEFGLNLTHQLHWVQFSPVTLQAGTMYAFLLSNTDSNPGTGGSASSGNHMSVNLNWSERLSDLGPNGTNNLDPTASGAVAGLTPRECAMWSDNSGTSWKFGDQVGWYQVGNGKGRLWTCGYRVSGGSGYSQGWPCLNWPSELSGRSITYRNASKAVTLTRAGGASDTASVGVITVTNTSTGVTGKTASLGGGMVSGTLDNPVPVAVGQNYTVAASGTVGMGSPTSGQGAAFGVGSRVPWNVTSNASNSQLPMLYATPHPFFADVGDLVTGSSVYRPVALLWFDDDLYDFPYGAEYDFWELNGPDDTAFQAFHHFPSLDGNDSQRRFTKDGVRANDWHHYALEWTANELIGYIDGVEVYRTSGGATSARRAIQDAPGPMHLCLQFDPTAATGLQAGVMEIDWIKVYPPTPITDPGGGEPGGGGGGGTSIGTYPTFTAVGSAVTGEDSSIAVPPPAGVGPGQVQICIIQCATNVGMTTVPAGWLLLDEQAVDNTDITGPPGGPSIAYIFYNTTGDSSSRTWVKTDTRAFHAVRMSWKDFSTVGQHSPRGSSYTLTPYANVVTPSTDKATVVTVMCSDRRTTGPNPVSVPNGWTQRYNSSVSVGSNAEIQTITVAEIKVDNKATTGGNVPTATGLGTSNFTLTNADNCSMFSFVIEGPVSTGTSYTGNAPLVALPLLLINIVPPTIPIGSLLLTAFPELSVRTIVRGGLHFWVIPNLNTQVALFPRGALIIVPNLTFTTQQQTIAGLLLQAAVILRAGALPYRRPVLRNEYEYPPEDHPFRLIAQRILDGEIVEWELPVSEDFQYTDQLSGPTIMQGAFRPELISVQELGLDGYAYWLHVEINQEIRASAILLPPQYEESGMAFTAEGVAAVPHYHYYGSIYRQIQVDPLSVVRTLWNYVQAQPQSDFGVEVSNNSSPVRLGEPARTETTVTENEDGTTTTTTREIPAEPYELVWWDAKNIGEELDALAGQTPFDFVERHQWNSSRTDVEHFIDLGYPRLGVARPSLLFNEENILEVVPVQEPEDTYASAVLVIGAGDGEDTIRAYRAAPFADRVRKQVVITDKTIKDQQRANARAEQELAYRRGRQFEVQELVIAAFHPNAPIGSYRTGDDIQVQIEVPWLDVLHTAWYRITSIQNRPSGDKIRLGVARSDTLLDTSDIWIEPEDYVPFIPPPPVGTVSWNANVFLLVQAMLTAVPPVPVPTANVIIIQTPILTADGFSYGGSFAFISLYADSNLTIAEAQTLFALASLSAEASIAVAGVATGANSGTATLISTTTLATSAIVVRPAQVSMSVVPALTTAATGVFASAVSLSATATLSADGLPIRVGAVSLEASPVLSANGTVSSQTTVTQLGNTTNNTSSSSSSASRTAVSKATASAGGAVTAGHCRLWVDTGSASVRMVVYADNAGAPGSLLGVSSAVTISNTAEALIDFVFSGANQASITQGSDYWVGFGWTDPGTNNIFWSRAGTSGQTQQAVGDAPNPFGTPTSLAGPIDAYVDVTSSSGGGGTGGPPEIRSSSTGVATTAATYTVPKPTGLAVGDLLIAFHEQSADTSAPALVSGFTSRATQNGVAASNIPSCRISTKVADSADVAASTFTFGNADTGLAESNCILVAIKAGTYNTTTPLVLTSYSTGTFSGGLQHTAPTISVDAANELLICAFAMDCNASDHNYPSSGGTAPSGMTQVAWVQDNANYTLQGIYQELRASTGATGTRSVTPGGATSTSNKGWATISILVQNP